MRAAPIFLVALAGCLSAPTGIDPVWPPPGADLAAVAGGDLDGDGKPDLVAIDVQADRPAVYVLRGGADLSANREVATRYSLAAPLDGARAPAVAMIYDGHVFVADNPVSGPRLTMLDAQLDHPVSHTLGGPPLPIDANLWIRHTTFGMSGSIVVGAGNDIRVVETGDLDNASAEVKTIPGPPAWNEPLAAEVYIMGGPPPKLVVAEPNKIWRTDVQMSGSFNFTDIHDNGTDWRPALLADLGGDGVFDVLGFAPNGAAPASLCAFDIAANSAPACATTPISADAPFAMQLADVGISPDLDLVLIHATPDTATLDVFPHPRITGASLVTDTLLAPVTRPVPQAQVVVEDLDGSQPPEMVLVSRDGVLQCLRATPSMIVDCVP